MTYLKIITAAIFSAVGIAPMLADVHPCPLPVMVKVLDGDCDLAQANTDLLDNKLEQIVTAEGFGGTDVSHLCLTASVSETEKNVISGTRPTVTTKIDVYLVLTNLLSGEKFGSEFITLNGAGRNESQAFRRAISQIDTHNKDFQKFLDRLYTKLMAYYDANLLKITQQAMILSNRGEYEKALYLLSTVPPCCNDYEAVGDAMLAVWQAYLDQDCAEKLSKAMAAWHSAQNEDAAAVALAYLAAIDHKSACIESAQTLLEEISAKVGENIARSIRWQEEDRELNREQIHADVDLKRAEIDALRDLALAYAQFVLGPALENLAKQRPAPIIDLNAPDGDTPTPPTPQSDEQ